MSVAGLAVVLAVGLAGLGIALNHCYARIALVELALNEGLPPGHEPASTHTTATTSSLDPATILPLGIHVFLSRNCHACQRLVDELDQTDLTHATELHLHYIDRPRPIATSAAARQRATLHGDHSEIATKLEAAPLPYTIAIGQLDLVSRAVTPTIAQVLAAARDGGIPIEAVANV